MGFFAKFTFIWDFYRIRYKKKKIKDTLYFVAGGYIREKRRLIKDPLLNTPNSEEKKKDLLRDPLYYILNIKYKNKKGSTSRWSRSQNACFCVCRVFLHACVRDRERERRKRREIEGERAKRGERKCVVFMCERRDKGERKKRRAGREKEDRGDKKKIGRKERETSYLVNFQRISYIKNYNI